ncbi:MAG: hypothetical protein H7138_01610 [Myxococcales bacterium]|nr:hypothetical protein [Myxococcales bacterium]
MTIDNSSSAGPPARTTLSASITITVTNNGSISPASYAATEGCMCAVKRVAGGTFVGSVKVMHGTKQIASWAVSSSALYVIPAPPTPPLTVCTLTTGVTNGGNGTINIGSRPPGATPPAPLTGGDGSSVA